MPRATLHIQSPQSRLEFHNGQCSGVECPWADRGANRVPKPLMSGQLLPVFVVATVMLQPLLASRTCNVSDDLSYGLANAGDCSTLELQTSVTLTAMSFSASSLSIDSQNLTIQSIKTAPEAVLDFGSYTLNGKFLITGTSSIMFKDITLKSYASSTVQNGTLTTFLPFFDVDSTSSIYMSDVRFLDSGRCSLEADMLATPRTSWYIGGPHDVQTSNPCCANSMQYVQVRFPRTGIFSGGSIRREWSISRATCKGASFFSSIMSCFGTYCLPDTYSVL